MHLIKVNEDKLRAFYLSHKTNNLLDIISNVLKLKKESSEKVEQEDLEQNEVSKFYIGRSFAVRNLIMISIAPGRDHQTVYASSLVLLPTNETFEDPIKSNF